MSSAQTGLAYSSSRMSDIHFTALESRISQQDSHFLFQTFGSEFNLFLKVFKLETETGQPESLLKFIPPVYTLVHKIGRSVLKVSLLSYNEEVMEENAFQVDPEEELEESVLLHILSSLEREYRACPGVSEASILLEVTVDNLLIEKYGDNIFYRSRDCSRLILDNVRAVRGGQPCHNCRAIQNCKTEVKVKNESPEEEEEEEDIEVKYEGGQTEEKKVRARKRRKRSDGGQVEVSHHHQCPLSDCQLRFKTEPQLVSHLLQFHPEHQQASSQPQGKYHKCPQSGCFLVFKHAMGKKMLTHLEEIHQVDGKKLELGVRSTVCSYCAKIFNTAFALRRHLQNTHEAPMVPCHICGQFIRGTQNLNVHLRVTHSNVKFKCPEPGCPVEAKNKDHLKDHIAAIHRNEPRYICSICGTRYKYRSKWKYCEDKHRGKFLHECDLCDKKFNDKRKFRIHQRVHTGEKPYMCPICNIRMARLDNLNAHTKKTHGMTWREAEKMTESTISGIPVSEHHKLPGT